MKALALVMQLIRPVRLREPPDGGLTAWTVVAAALLCNVFTVGLVYVTGLFGTAFLLDDGLGERSKPQVSLALSSCYGAFLLYGVPAGKLIARSGARLCLLAGTAATFIGLMGTSLAPSLPWLFLTLHILGAGICMGMSAALFEVQQFFKKRRSTATGIAVTGTGVGGLILGPWTQAMITSMGWRGAARVLAITTGSLLPVAALFMPLVVLLPAPDAAADVKAAAAGGAPSAAGVPVDSSTTPSDPWSDAIDTTVVPDVLSRAADADASDSQSLHRSSAYAASGSDGWDTGALVAPGSAPADDQRVQRHVEKAAPSASGAVEPPPISPDASVGGWQEDTSSVAVSPTSPPPLPATPPPASPAAGPSLTVRQLLRIRPFAWLSFGLFLYGGSFYMALSALNTFAVRDNGVDPEAAAFLVSIQGVTNILGRLIVGIISDSPRMSRPVLLGLNIGVVGLAVLLLPSLGSQYWYLAVFFSIYGFGGGSVVSLVTPILVDLVAMPSVAVAAGVTYTVQAPACVFWPPVVGWMRDATGSYTLSWMICAALMIVSAVIFATEVRGVRLVPKGLTAALRRLAST